MFLNRSFQCNTFYLPWPVSDLLSDTGWLSEISYKNSYVKSAGNFFIHLIELYS